MNTQLLKRTAVALFITGVISSSAFATDPLIAALANTSQQLKDDVSDLKQSHNDLANHVTSEINRVTEYVNNMSDDIDTNTAEIEKIKENHNGLADHVTSEINRVTEYVNNMSDDIDTNTAEIEKLKNTSSFLDAAKVEKNTQDIRAQNSMIETKANKTYVDSKLADKADKAELASKADKTELVSKADKAELASKADKTELASKADKTSVTKNETMIKANTADIAQLKSMQQKNISALKTKVDRNSARIDQLDSRVNDLDKEVKNGLASQAALSGLFQPYNVGKVNMSAAVGGYKSKTALAVGTGYRFNENIAAKAGVSFSANGGGASYNAGINFEW